MEIPVNFGGGGSAGSDDCTAVAADVLESKTAIYNGSDEEAEYGTMKDCSGTSAAASAINDNSSNSRVEMTVPTTGKYDTAARIYSTNSNTASAIGLTSAKLATGNTIIEVAGSYCGVGNATASQVLSGKTFSTASLSNTSGGMANKSGASTAATSSVSGSNYRMVFPAVGYYDTSSYLTNSYSKTAETIGLTAAKIKNGETILGITGTCNQYTATSTDAYYGGSTNLAGSATVINGTSSTAKLDTACIILNASKSGSEVGYIGVVFNTAVNMSSYSRVTVTYQPIHHLSNNSDTIIGIGVYATKPTSESTLSPVDHATAYTTIAVDSNKTFGSSYSDLYLNLSNVTGSLYLAVFYNNGSGSSSTYSVVTVTRIAFS